MDCSKTQIFFDEYKRMCKEIGKDGNLNLCPLKKKYKGGCGWECYDFVVMYPERVIKIVQEWSNSHQPKTRMSVLREQYPRLEMDVNDGLPSEICAGILYGFDCEDGMSCKECWNTPIEEAENE